MGRDSQSVAADRPEGAVRVINCDGQGRFVVLCDHACRYIPPEYASLGLAGESLERHIAWDPGALEVAAGICEALDAPLIHSAISRLVIDVNRAPDAADLIAKRSEDTDIPGNHSLDHAARAHRIAAVYEPYHRAIDELVSRRVKARLATALISVHTFTPVYRTHRRAWHVGILHAADQSIAGPLIAALSGEAGIIVGDNEPYSPRDGVYYTLARHGDERGLATAMIEIRNDLVADEAGQRDWAERLVRVLGALDLPARAA